MKFYLINIFSLQTTPSLRPLNYEKMSSNENISLAVWEKYSPTSPPLLKGSSWFWFMGDTIGFSLKNKSHVEILNNVYKLEECRLYDLFGSVKN